MNLLNEALTLPTGFSLTQEAQSYVAGLMMESQGIEVVTDPQTQQHAVRMGREFRRHLAEVEMTRKQLKEPLLTAGHLLDDITKNHCAPMVAEVNRLENLINQFQLAEQARIEAVELARQAEIDRLAQERLKAEHAVEDVKPTGDEALDDIKKAEAEAALEAAEAKERTAVVAPLPEPVKAKGASTGQKLQVEVTDLKALFAARPDLCRIEANLAKIRSECVPEMPVPGLKLTYVTKTTIRK